MQRLSLLLIPLLLALSGPASAALKIFATVPEWAALAQEIGGDKVSVFSATQALQDPHRVEAKPSLIARLRNADLVVATGAELEVGWLPLALRESANGKVQPGQPGYFEAAAQVRMLEVPSRLDRADGDVHASGNPHIQTDPRNILKVGDALSKRMGELDAANAAAYAASYKAFAEKWRSALARWEAAAAPLKGKAVVSQHKAWAYLYDWLGLKEVGALEPKPGIEPSVAWLGELAGKVGWRRSVFFSISPRRREFVPADDLLSCLCKKVGKEAPPTVSALRATRRCTPENGRGRKLACGSDSGPGRPHFPRRITGSTEGMGGAL
jgi:zinc/manganese transport system substrate-binding protein